MGNTAYFVCPDDDQPAGGIRKIYRFVDVLNVGHRSATVVHSRPRFRCSWFDNQTRITPAKDVRLTTGDLLVIPEIYRGNIPKIAPGAPHVVLNQGAYITFTGSSLIPDAWDPVVSPSDTIGLVTVSEDSREYLRWCFPDLPVDRIRLGIDSSLFFPPSEGKRKSLAFMPRRNRQGLVQLLRILGLRGALAGWELTPIDNVSEAGAARLLRSSAVFLSFSRQEGFGLPSLEAMACGCVVVGHHGGGGREFLRPGISYPIDEGDILQFARTVEDVLATWNGSSTTLESLGQRASAFARGEYSEEQEAGDVLRIFGDALDSVAGREPGSRELNLDLLATPRWRRLVRPLLVKLRQGN